MDGTGTTARGTARETTRNELNDRTHDREHDRLLDHERNLPAPSARLDGKGRRQEETAKRETSRENGAGNGKGILYPIRLPRKYYRMTNMYKSCVLTI